jgi:hypothetical protein
LILSQRSFKSIKTYHCKYHISSTHICPQIYSKSSHSNTSSIFIDFTSDQKTSSNLLISINDILDLEFINSSIFKNYFLNYFLHDDLAGAGLDTVGADFGADAHFHHTDHSGLCGFDTVGAGFDADADVHGHVHHTDHSGLCDFDG